MKPIREVIIERLVHNQKLTNPDIDMEAYIMELEDYTDYDLLDEFEIMLTETQ